MVSFALNISISITRTLLTLKLIVNQCCFYFVF